MHIISNAILHLPNSKTLEQQESISYLAPKPIPLPFIVHQVQKKSI
jgi:hypothetical protein